MNEATEAARLASEVQWIATLCKVWHRWPHPAPVRIVMMAGRKLPEPATVGSPCVFAHTGWVFDEGQRLQFTNEATEAARLAPEVQWIATLCKVWQRWPRPVPVRMVMVVGRKLPESDSPPPRPRFHPFSSTPVCFEDEGENEEVFRSARFRAGTTYFIRNPPLNSTSASVTAKNTRLITAFNRKNALLIQSRLRRRAIQCSITRQSAMMNQPTM